MGLRISSWYRMAVRVPRLAHGVLCGSPKKFPPRPSLTHCQTGHAGGCCRQQNALHGITNSVTSVTCAQGEPDLISEGYRVLMANLPTLMFSGKCQPDCTVLGCKYRSHLWTPCSHTTLKESVSDCLSRNVHISSLLEVILWGSGSAPPVPACTKKQTTVLLLGCCAPSPPSMSPSVLARPLVSPPCS